MSEIQLFLQLDTGLLTPINISPESKVLDFRAQISQIINKPVNSFRILFQGREMEDEHALKDYCVEDKCVVLIIEKESNIQGCLYYPVEIIVPVLDYLDGYSENVYSYEIQNMFKVSLTFISIIQGMVYLLTAVTTYFINIPYYIYICILGVIISIVIFFIASCPSPRSLRVVKAILIVMSLVTTSFTIFYFFPWDSLMNVENIQATLNLIFPIIANIVPLLYIERINRRVNNNLRDRGSTVSDLGIID